MLGYLTNSKTSLLTKGVASKDEREKEKKAFHDFLENGCSADGF